MSVGTIVQTESREEEGEAYAGVGCLMECVYCFGRRIPCTYCKGYRVITGPCASPEEQARQEITLRIVGSLPGDAEGESP